MAMISCVISLMASCGVIWSIVALVIILIVLWYATIPRRLPPGPYGLPFLGCIPYLQVLSPHFVLERWTRKYGSVMSFYMGNHLVVVLSDRRVLDESLVKRSEAYAGRPPILLPQPKRIRKGHGLITAEGDLWKEQRRFAERTIRDFCSLNHQSAFEDSLYSEVQRLCTTLNSLPTKDPLDMHPPIARTASSVMCKLLFGRSLDDERSLQAQIERINYRNAGASVHPLSAILYMPWMIHLPFLKQAMQKFLREGDEITEFFQDRIDETISTFDPQKMPTNYVHAFLMARQNGHGDYFTDEQLLPAVFQLFVGGTETITTTLRWALHIMANHPHEQQAVFDEIQTKLQGEPVRKEDMSRLPLTQATLMEIMRVATILPMSAIHRTTMETTIDGYVIPADTRIIPFLYNVHRDQNTFPEPLKFDPLRFIGKDGGLISNASWIPYSLGKRKCPAISLAKVELFIIFASLIHNFKFSFSPEERPRTEDCGLGFCHCPPSGRLLVQNRAEIDM